MFLGRVSQLHSLTRAELFAEACTSLHEATLFQSHSSIKVSHLDRDFADFLAFYPGNHPTDGQEGRHYSHHGIECKAWISYVHFPNASLFFLTQHRARGRVESGHCSHGKGQLSDPWYRDTAVRAHGYSTGRCTRQSQRQVCPRTHARESKKDKQSPSALALLPSVKLCSKVHSLRRQRIPCWAAIKTPIIKDESVLGNQGEPSTQYSL